MNPLLFIAWLPVIELLLLIAMAALFGFWFTLAWIIGTAVLGVYLLKRVRRRLGAVPGGAAGWRMSPPLQAAEMPGVLASWLGAVLLILPGPLTDLVGFLLVIPVLRELAIGAWVARQAERWMAGRASQGRARQGGAGRVYEGEVVSPASRPTEQISRGTARHDEPPGR